MDETYERIAREAQYAAHRTDPLEVGEAFLRAFPEERTPNMTEQEVRSVGEQILREKAEIYREIREVLRAEE